MENKSNFNQALWLGIGYTCSMLVGIVSSIVLSRFFDKDQYGTYKQIIFVYNTLLTLFQAGLPTVFTYFLPRHNQSEGKFIVRKLQRLLFLLGACFSACLFFGSGLIASLLKNPELAVGLKIFAVFPLFTLPTLGVEGIYTVNKNTRFVAVYQVITRLVMLICIVVPVVFIKNDYRYAMIGWGIASFIAFIIAIIAKNRVYSNVDVVEISGLTKEIFRYSLPIMGASLVWMLFSSANQFFISRYYGTSVFAEYSNGFMSLPFVAIFIHPVRSILTPIFAKANKEGSYDMALKSLYGGMMQVMTIMIPLLVVSFFCAKEIMVFFYGDAYETSFIFFRIDLLFSFAEVFVFSGVLNAIGKTRTVLYINICCTVLLWMADLLLIKLGWADPYIISFVFVLVNALAQYIIPGVILTKKEKIVVISKEVVIHLLKVSVHAVCVGLILSCISRMFFDELSVIWRLILYISVFYAILILSMKAVKVNYLESMKRLLVANKK